MSRERLVDETGRDLIPNAARDIDLGELFVAQASPAIRLRSRRLLSGMGSAIPTRWPGIDTLPVTGSGYSDGALESRKHRCPTAASLPLRSNAR